jgi:hypothetical protein
MTAQIKSLPLHVQQAFADYRGLFHRMGKVLLYTILSATGDG